MGLKIMPEGGIEPQSVCDICRKQLPHQEAGHLKDGSVYCPDCWNKGVEIDPRLELAAKAFLVEFTKLLDQGGWGKIEPHWFDPRFVINNNPEDLFGGSEELGWAKDLQERITKALAKIIQFK